MVYLYLMMGFFLFDLQSLEEPFHLLERDFLYFIRCPEPLKLHIIQKFFRCQDESILIIPQNFYGISFSVAEDKNTVSIIRIQFEAETDSSSQSGDLFSKICGSALSEYLDNPQARKIRVAPSAIRFIITFSVSEEVLEVYPAENYLEYKLSFPENRSSAGYH